MQHFRCARGCLDECVAWSCATISLPIITIHMHSMFTFCRRFLLSENILPIMVTTTLNNTSSNMLLSSVYRDRKPRIGNMFVCVCVSITRSLAGSRLHNRHSHRLRWGLQNRNGPTAIVIVQMTQMQNRNSNLFLWKPNKWLRMLDITTMEL